MKNIKAEAPDEVKLPEPPPSRLIKEWCFHFCVHCGSSRPRKYILFGTKKCIGCGKY